MNRLKQKYQQEVVPKLQKEFGIKNLMAVPKIVRVVVHMGVAQPQEARKRTQILPNIEEQFKLITGQKPVITKARISIASYKLRAGDPLGVMVTLRGEKMWQFLDKLIGITLPRLKDFRGVSIKAFDGQGNYSLGLEEQIVFPEINYDKIESIRGLQVNIVTNAKQDNPARSMLKYLGMPFEKEENK